MATRATTKYIHEGHYAAAVDVQLIDDDTAWTSHLSLDDAYKLGDVRQALRANDLSTAAHLATVYENQLTQEQSDSLPINFDCVHLPAWDHRDALVDELNQRGSPRTANTR